LAEEGGKVWEWVYLWGDQASTGVRGRQKERCSLNKKAAKRNEFGS